MPECVWFIMPCPCNWNDWCFAYNMPFKYYRVLNIRILGTCAYWEKVAWLLLFVFPDKPFFVFISIFNPFSFVLNDYSSDIDAETCLVHLLRYPISFCINFGDWFPIHVLVCESSIDFLSRPFFIGYCGWNGNSFRDTRHSKIP